MQTPQQIFADAHTELCAAAVAVAATEAIGHDAGRERLLERLRDAALHFGAAAAKVAAAGGPKLEIRLVQADTGTPVPVEPTAELAPAIDNLERLHAQLEAIAAKVKQRDLHRLFRLGAELAARAREDVLRVVGKLLAEREDKRS